MIIWLTGLSGAGKTTLTEALVKKLKADGVIPLVLDGDVMRTGLSADLGFSTEDRSENIRRAGSVAVLAARSGIVSICSLISPLRKDREIVRMMSQANGVSFFEIFVDAPLEVCEQRDPKGLYKMARSGLISNSTGISAPYEPPLYPELVVRTAKQNIKDSLQEIYASVSELDAYESALEENGIEKYFADVILHMKALFPKKKVGSRFSGWLLPLAYLIAVLTLDKILPYRTLSSPLLAMGLIVCALTLQPKKMFFWTAVYVVVNSVILFYVPLYSLMNNGAEDYDPVANGLRVLGFFSTAVILLFTSTLINRLRDKVGSFSRVLTPRVYRLSNRLQ